MQPPFVVPCGWYGSLDHFLMLEEHLWLQSLATHHQVCMLEPPSAAQVVAWQHSFSFLQRECHLLIEQSPSAAQWSIIFEYELPRERGRRPDVVLLAGSAVIVLEFKEYSTPLQAHLDQVAAYARDLRHYHAASHHLEVLPVLVPTAYQGPMIQQEGVWITPTHHLAGLLTTLVPPASLPSLDPQVWLAADYSPLPSLVTAARIIFQHEPLPQIRRAQSAGIPETIATLVAIAKTAQARGERHLST